MRFAIGIAGIVFLGACATPRGDDGAASEAAKSARAQLGYLRALEGTWWGTGVQGTDRNPVEFRYRVTDGGAVVEETCFIGKPEALVTRYSVDGARLVAARSSASGPAVQFVAAPDQPAFVGTCTGTGRVFSRSCDDDPPVEDSMKWSDVTYKEDPHLHNLVLRPDILAQGTRTDAQQEPGYCLLINGDSGIIAMWETAAGDNQSVPVRSYRLTRTRPSSVVRTADRESPKQSESQGKKSWQDERPYWDLRSEP
jgi:hypothetical protein